MKHSTLLRVVLCLVCCALFAFAVAGCDPQIVLYIPSAADVGGGDGLDGGGAVDADIGVPPLIVAPLYPRAGADWNDYVANDGVDAFSATDTPCVPSEADSRLACLHGAEMRVLRPPGLVSCSEITAYDTLGLLRWRCVMRGGEAQIVSTSLAEGKGLRHALEPGAFRDNSLVVLRSGDEVVRTPPAKWWSNAILALPPGGGPHDLDQAGAVYQVNTARDSQSVSFRANGVALVTMQDGSLRYDRSGAPSCSAIQFCAVVLEGRERCWAEVALEAGAADFGYYDSGGHFNTLNASVISGGDTAVSAVSPNARIREVSASRFSTWGVVAAGRGARLYNVSAAEGSATCCQKAGINLTASGAIAHRIKVFSNHRGLQLGANDLTLSAVLAVNNVWAGEVTRKTRQTLTHFTMSNRDRAIVTWPQYFWDSNTAVQWLSAGHGERGLELFSDGNTFVNYAAASNGSSSILISGAATSNRFSGLLLVGAAGQRCEVDSTGASPGLIDATCTDTGAAGSSSYTGQLSDAVLVVDRDFSGSFVGRVSSDDLQNLDDNAGAAEFATLTDWARFENFWRVWGKGNAPCNSDTCSLYDYRLALADDQARERTQSGAAPNAAFLPGEACPPAAHGDRAVRDKQAQTHTSGANAIVASGAPCAAGELCLNEFLINALEIIEDAVGDDDGLCESNEACIYSPNFGAYQGEGPLIGPCLFEDGTVFGVTLYAHSINGA